MKVKKSMHGVPEALALSRGIIRTAVRARTSRARTFRGRGLACHAWQAIIVVTDAEAAGSSTMSHELVGSRRSHRAAAAGTEGWYTGHS
eukprot:COSAG01_NODE_1529_length_10001_cov_2.242583_9_plen_89_part_00